MRRTPLQPDGWSTTWTERMGSGDAVQPDPLCAATGSVFPLLIWYGGSS